MEKKSQFKRSSILRRSGVSILTFLMILGMLPVLFEQGIAKADSCYEATETDSNGVEWNLIGTLTELTCVQYDLNGNYKLKTDITEEVMSAYLNGGSWLPITEKIEEEPQPFTGRFDGEGHSISGLKSTDENQDYVGLFYGLRDAEVKNLILKDVSFVGNARVGGLAGDIANSIIEGVHLSGDIKGNIRVGGITGLSDDSTYLDNSTNVTVVASGEEGDSLGGLIGESNRDTILRNATEGEVNGYEVIGGLIGESNGTSIHQSYGSGRVTGNYQVGGLIGQLNFEQDQAITDNYVVGYVNSVASGENEYAAEAIGGLIGEVKKVRRSDDEAQINIRNNYVAASFAIGDPDDTSLMIDEQTIGSVVGSLVDPEAQVNFSNIYYDLIKSSLHQQGQANNGNGIPTEQMKQQSSYNAWDFVEVWTFRQGINDGYPVLRSSKMGNTPNPPHPDPTINFAEGYPKHGLVTQTTSKITVKLNKAGRFYFDNDEWDMFADQQTKETTKLNAVNKQSYIDLDANEEMSFLSKGLIGNIYYRLYMAVEDTNGQLVDMGSWIYATLNNLTPLPEEVSATAGDGQATIHWTGDPELNYYVYMYKGTEAPEDPDLWINVTELLTNEQAITGLTNGESYVFAVRSYASESMNSNYVPSNVVIPQGENSGGGGTDPDPDFPVPQHVVATKSGKQVTLSWDNLSNGIASVYMYEGTSPPDDSSQWILVSSSVLADHWEIRDLREGGKYIFAVKAHYQGGLSEYGVSNVVTIEADTSNPETPGNGGGGIVTPAPSTPSPSAPAVTSPAPQKEVIKVDVENGDQASTIASLEISRTRGTDGTVRDELQLNQSKAQLIIDQLKQTGSSTAVILIPDAKDEVSQWDLTLSSGSSALLAEQGVNLIISNPNVRITIPASSLKDRTDDIYFRLVPVKKEAERADIQTRAQSNESIIQFAGTQDIQILGRPMTIQTNLQSRPVTLVLPIGANQLVGVKSEELGVYIEHSNGTKELVHGKLVNLDSNNQQGVEIEVDQFSTFSIVKVKDWTHNTLNARPYIQGYVDGSFRPERSVSRAEMATLITRVLGGTSTTEGNHTFKDVKSTHWAQSAIAAAAQSGYVKGYTNGSFKPDQAMTRGELASVLQHLLSAEQAADATNTFNDLNNHWAQQAIAQLNAVGVVTGYADGTFRPGQLVTRAEAVTMLNKLIGLESTTNVARQWSDVPDTHWAYKAIEAASISQ
ncbi:MULTISPECIES: S-layer homology domain-containing protein [Paenibacillus]|uniref:S-layer homology domain-containing protein n=1 Tax=Paenibacillus TaxID=44249 RepID=UPI000886B4C4|nr:MULTISPECIES: S-layer homology domain-containing protein [Paenibacillus]MCL6664240.1 S-layer homology domain-containing protein [Paenibacillus amylolyticus]SDD94001.1 S-layer homology domain-containing protein [Paenibacillus sp. CF095]